jgi:curli production assembly/transport component CsgG
MNAKTIISVGLLLFLGGCAFEPINLNGTGAKLTPKSEALRDLKQLPEPKGKIAVAVYGLRDQTGQYKPSPDSSFSTAVTQGGAAMLVKALLESNWFMPVERENLQNLLTERKIVRALENPQDKGDTKANPASQAPPLMPANILIEGGIVAYESNVRTGGAGARYLGIGASMQYRVDQVTVSLRAIDVRSGQILHSVSTTKTIYSQLLNSGVYKFVSFKELLELEMGYSRNEPTQLCVNEAIEAAVLHLIVQGLDKRLWALKNPEEINHPLIQTYLKEAAAYAETSAAELDVGHDPNEGASIGSGT